MIKDLPLAERPRERLLAHGSAALSHAELLAIVLGTGDAATGRSALAVAQDLLAWCRQREHGDDTRRAADAQALRALVTASPEEFCEVPGIGLAKAARVIAAVELGRRLGRLTVQPTVITSPSAVAGLLHDEMRYLREEHLRVVMLNTKRHVIAVETISIGGLDSTVVHGREVFRAAIKRSAASIILAHNHPSGDPTPSQDDLVITRRLIEAGNVIGIDVVDHIIIGDSRYVSLREMHGQWFR